MEVTTNAQANKQTNAQITNHSKLVRGRRSNCYVDISKLSKLTTERESAVQTFGHLLGFWRVSRIHRLNAGVNDTLGNWMGRIWTLSRVTHLGSMVMASLSWGRNSYDCGCHQEQQLRMLLWMKQQKWMLYNNNNPNSKRLKHCLCYDPAVCPSPCLGAVAWYLPKVKVLWWTSHKQLERGV